MISYAVLSSKTSSAASTVSTPHLAAQPRLVLQHLVKTHCGVWVLPHSITIVKLHCAA
jgi:hypothetical protein